MAGFKDVRDITAWRLAHQLNLRVDLFLLSPDFRRYYTASAQLGVAVRSGPRHIAEGSERLRHKDFAQCVRAARESEASVLAHLIDAREQLLITHDEFLLTKQLTRRAMRAANRLIRSLESTPEFDVPPASTPRIPPRTQAFPTDWD